MGASGRESGVVYDVVQCTEYCTRTVVGATPKTGEKDWTRTQGVSEAVGE